MSSVLFLTDRGQVHQQLALSSAPPELEVRMLRRPTDPELIEAVRDVEFIISERDRPVSRAVIEAAPKLKLIVRLGSLLHGIDLEAARAAGVAVSQAPIRSSILAAEHALMMTLALMRRLGRALATGISSSTRPARPAAEDVFAYNWNGYPDMVGLAGKSALVWGMGEIGVELVRRLRPFSLARVLYQKRSRYPAQIEAELGITFSPLEPGLSQADVVLCALPLSDATRGAVSERALATFKPSAVLVHVGSGGVVDEEAVARAVAEGRLAGAALDTFSLEPFPPEHRLAKLARDPHANVLLTPHIASGSEPSEREQDYAEIVRCLRGQPLLMRV